MPNTILTPTAVTREAQRVLHQKLNFIGSINRQYDDSFATSGAKIGDSLKIRLPNEYVVRSGATLAAQDTSEISTTLTVGTQKGVDLNFTSADLTLSLQDFSDRIVEPAMSVLAATMEADALTMYRDVSKQVNAQGAAATFRNVLQGRQRLNDALAPAGKRVALLNTTDNVDLVDALKGLFNDAPTLSKQYKEGMMGRTAGFDFYENTLIPSHARGSANAAYTVNGAGQVGSSIVVAVGAGTLSVGDVVTFAGCFDVHPETKAARATLKQFTITTAYAGGAGSIAISPAIVATGARQNVSASPTNGGAVVVAGAVSTAHGISMLYAPEAFTFASADLIMPEGVDWSAREVYDGLSMRIVRQYDINNDKFPCRLDVLYGFKTVREQLAVRLAAN